MSTFGDNQVRKIFIANAVNSAVRSTPDDLAEGEVQAFNADGSGTAVAGEKFYIATKTDGIINTSELIDPSKNLDYREASFEISFPKWVVTLTGTPTAATGKVVDFSIQIDNYGASNSSSEPYYLHASHVIESGDTLTTIAAGIVTNGNAAVAKTGLPITFASSAGVVTIETSRTPFVLGKFNGEALKASLVTKVDDTDLTATTVASFVASTSNGMEVANMEWFMLGNTGDIYRGMGYPNNIDSNYVADSTANYNAVELTYYSERLSAPGDKQRAMITICYDSTLTSGSVDAQITDPIDTYLGV